MASKTTNYQLHKIDLTDAPPDITVLNQNWDTVDDILKSKYSYVKTLTKADDLNNITTDGIYTYTSTSVPTNAPYTNASVVEVFGLTSNTDYKIQRVTRSGSAGQIAVRSLSSGTWLDWKYLVTQGDLEAYFENLDLGVYAKTSDLANYLPLSGGVMTGSGFYLNNKTGRIVNNANGMWLRTASSDVDNNKDSRHLKLWNATYMSDLADSLFLFDSTTGKDYAIYGEHNKPSASEIGAAGLQTGSYSGSGKDNSQPVYADDITVKGRKITLPCTPKLMYLWSVGNGGNGYQLLSQGSKLYFTIGSNKFTVAYLEGNSLYVVSTSNTTTSFGCDNSGVAYNWFAFV